MYIQIPLSRLNSQQDTNTTRLEICGNFRPRLRLNDINLSNILTITQKTKVRKSLQLSRIGLTQRLNLTPRTPIVWREQTRINHKAYSLYSHDNKRSLQQQLNSKQIFSRIFKCVIFHSRNCNSCGVETNHLIRVGQVNVLKIPSQYTLQRYNAKSTCT